MEKRPARAWTRPDVRIGAVLAIAALVALVVWLLVRGGGSGSENQRTAEPISPVAASPSRIRDLSVEVGRPIYWLGPEEGKVYELQRTIQDRIYVRYLPPRPSLGTKQGGLSPRRPLPPPELSHRDEAGGLSARRHVPGLKRLLGAEGPGRGLRRVVVQGPEG